MLCIVREGSMNDVLYHQCRIGTLLQFRMCYLHFKAVFTVISQLRSWVSSLKSLVFAVARESRFGPQVPLVCAVGRIAGAMSTTGLSISKGPDKIWDWVRYQGCILLFCV